MAFVFAIIARMSEAKIEVEIENRLFCVPSWQADKTSKQASGNPTEGVQCVSDRMLLF